MNGITRVKRPIKGRKYINKKTKNVVTVNQIFDWYGVEFVDFRSKLQFRTGARMCKLKNFFKSYEEIDK